MTYIFDKFGKYTLVLQKGKYKFECWGASGGNRDIQSSSGAYTAGTIEIPTRLKVFLFVGEKGKLNGDQITFNGGGAATVFDNSQSLDAKYIYACSGGGSTDIRISDGDWNDFESLKSRIIVAAGAGGEINYPYGNYMNRAVSGGNGGIYSGENAGFSERVEKDHSPVGEYKNAEGGSQTSGGKGGGGAYSPGNDGSFGTGGSGKIFVNEYGHWVTSGGGGGYFGGGSGGVSNHRIGAGAGGSSFVSGMEGCVAISRDFTEENRKFSSGSKHFSGYYFNDIIVKEGKEIGMDSKDGKIQITYLSNTVGLRRSPIVPNLMIVFQIFFLITFC